MPTKPHGERAPTHSDPRPTHSEFSAQTSTALLSQSCSCAHEGRPHGSTVSPGSRPLLKTAPLSLLVLADSSFGLRPSNLTVF